MYIPFGDSLYFDRLEAQLILQCASCYRLHMTLSAVHTSWSDPCISCQGIVGDALCCVYIEGGDFSDLWFGFVTRFWPKLAKMKVPLPPAVIGQRILSGNSTASLFCNLQINIYGSACSAGLCGSRPSGKIEERAFGGLQLSLCLLSWAWRGEQHKCALFCHRVNKIELNCALCFWKLPWVNTCTSPIVQCCEMHTLHLEPQNNLKGLCEEKELLLTTARFRFIIHEYILFGLQ